MFEGVVRQLLLGYLGRYIKDFNKEQLKIDLWKEKLVFENVELILEAFDYLQLPFALKEGRVGRLSIMIPWSKLGWDPIIILLEDVFFCAGERDDYEWCADAVDKRELAAKKAKLAAAELAKLSRRVCDNQAGQSFISHIAGRILDNILVTIKNFHIQYCKIQPDLMQMLFGLTFKSVIVTRHNLGKKARSGQVSKMVEIHGLGIYCTTFKGSLDLVSVDASGVSQVGSRTEAHEDQYVLIPFDASLLVIKSGKLDHDAPQYSVTAELTNLVMSIDTRQLRHILVFCDSICICPLREKYGRYRPLGRMLYRKVKGWEKAWWHYAQNAVLSDVRKKLKKFSWRYLAERLDSRHKYVKLYKIKLSFLQKEQPVDLNVLEELQQMENDVDIDDILKFRSIAERQMEELASNSTNSDFCMEGPIVSAERSQDDDSAPIKTRSWLNWLSRGVLGAGGTEDSNQFSGVVSAEVIKDICEATKFQPMRAHDDDVSGLGINSPAIVKISANQISLSLRTLKSHEEFAKLNLCGFSVECKVWEDSATIISMIESTHLLNSSEKTSILQMERETSEKNQLDINQPAIRLQMDILPKAQEADLSVKVMLQPLEIDFNFEFFFYMLEFYSVFESVGLLQDRTLKSLNGISDVMSRLSSKAEYISSSRRRVIWDLNFTNLIMRIPLSTLDMLTCSLVIRAAGLHISSSNDFKAMPKDLLSKSANSDRCLETDTNCIAGFQLEELYDYYEVELNDVEILLIMPCFPQGNPIVDKTCVSITLALCIIPEETVLKQLQAHIVIQSFHVHTSPSICGTILRMAKDMHLLLCECKKRLDMESVSSDVVSSTSSAPLFFSLTAKTELITLDINLEDSEDASSCVMLKMQQVLTQFTQVDLKESLVSVKKINITGYHFGSKDDILTLCSSGISSNGRTETAIVDDCFVLSYHSHETQHSIEHSCSLCLNDIELHFYPKIIGLLADFCEKLIQVYEDTNEQHSDGSKEYGCSGEAHALQIERFGFLNIHGNGLSKCDSIPLSQFPFVRAFNSKDKHARILKSSKCSDAPPSNSQRNETPSLGYSSGRFPFTTEIKLKSINLHFHDASSIVGSVTLPVSEVLLGGHENCLELLCSVEGLTLSSPWWVRNNQELLWAPLMANKSPILNLRFSTGPSFSTATELAISVQNVRCILPPEYLAILIGYFSLPDWATVENKQKAELELQVAPNEKTIIYQFEILECSLASPIEGDDDCFLMLEIPELIGNFILNDSSENALDDIMPECLVSVDKIAAQIDSLNLFGHNLSLSHLLFNNNVYNSLAIDEAARTVTHSLIQSLNVDLWIRIPCDSVSMLLSDPSRTCVMANIASCVFIAEDCYFAAGLRGLSDVIDQYSLVGKEAKYFTHDIQQFLQLKRAVKEGSHVQPVELSSNTLTEVICYAGLICFKLHRSNVKSEIREVVARMDTSFRVSTSLINDTVSSLDANFSSLSLVSLVNHVTLGNCLSDDSALSVLSVHLSTSDQNQMEVLVTLPSMDLWLYMYDWSEIVDLLNSYFRLSSSECKSACTRPESVLTDVSYTIRSEDMGILFHIPVENSEELTTGSKASFSEQETTYNYSLLPEGPKECKFITVALQSGNCDVFLDGANIKFRSTFGKTIGSVGIRESGVSRLWPFFKLCQLSVEFEVFDYYMVPLNVKADVNCESFDVWLSHQVIYFWNGLEFEDSKENNNAYDFGRFDINFQLSKASLLLTDGRWSCNGPLFELILRHLYLVTIIEERRFEVLASCNLNINYNNVQKVLWEPFVEPCAFEISMIRKHDKSALLSDGIMMDIQLKSTTGLNINFTESVIEVIFRAAEMVKDAQGLMQSHMDGQGLQNYQHLESSYARRYAPYVIKNMTSLPLVFRIYQGLMLGEGVDVLASKEETTVPSGVSVPIYLDEELEGEAFNYKPNHSSDVLNKQQSNSSGHHFMTIQFEGTAEPSDPVSMDLVGLTYFEVDFSKGHSKADVDGRLLVPVVFDVSVQRGTKFIQLYSTVILTNSTSTPLELRFDIPFGIAPKIVDPIFPGQEFPLPLHLAEAGRISWRPLGNNYLWSESHNLSNILLSEGRSGFLRSLVCYPSNPSSDPFRCCTSVQDICLPFLRRPKIGSQTTKGSSKQSVRSDIRFSNLEQPKSRFIHRVILNTPLMVKNYLPEAVSITVESGGISRSILLTEVETSAYHIDSSHDLIMTFNIDGFRPSTMNFPRSETFSTMAKSCGTFLSLTETMSIHSSSNGSVFVTVDKMMDASSGARVLCLSVPFLLYNCSGFQLNILSAGHELKSPCLSVPSCYNSSEQFIFQRDGLGLLSSEKFSLLKSSRFVSQSDTLSVGKSIITTDIIGRDAGLSPKVSSTGGSSVHPCPSLIPCDLDSDKDLLNNEDNNKKTASISANVSQSAKAKPYMFSPYPSVTASEVMVRLSRTLPECSVKNTPNNSWSAPFFLVAPSASTTVLVPQPFSSSATVISVTSTLLDIPLSSRTRAICFQPRYVISNACGKSLCYKQKGSDYVFQLGVGAHSHLLWPDTMRELLVSVRFDDPGWQWSGCFSPDHPGDQQVKMRNYLSGASYMIRVEVQNADDVGQDDVLGSTFSNSGTNFILLSDDDTGFMPYRIDNFSKETLRVYQQKCETLETIIYPYTSCPYSWDEPCYPHRLIVEVPGERIIGSYTMDDMQQYPPVHLRSSSERHERTLLSSVHAEGVMKVLSIVDSNCHVLGDLVDANSSAYVEKKRQNDGGVNLVDYKERISVTICSVGMSLINSFPQEVLFVCAKDIKLDLSQTVEQQKFTFKISSLKVDNQSSSTQYPVTLSFDQEHRGNLAGYTRYEDQDIKPMSGSLVPSTSVSSCEPVVWISAAKWRNKDTRLVSFESINIRIADFHLEVDQELLLSLIDFYRAIVSIKSMGATYMHSESNGFEPEKDKMTASSIQDLQNLKFLQASENLHLLKVDSFSLRFYKNKPSLPEVVPVGAPWQKIYLFARRHNKIFVEAFSIAPTKITLSFSSNPWTLKSGALVSGESLIQRGLMALADIEGATISLRKLTITHHIASWESIREIVSKHYTKQFLHEMFKVFGSAGVIGNPMGFARRVGHGIKDFLSDPAKGVLESPAGLITGMAHGTTSLVSNTLYAISDAATQFSKAAHKGILAFTFDHQDVSLAEKQQLAALSHSKGVISEVLEGLTGLLQSPIRGAEKHGLPGVLSGFALGVTGLVARPAASVLEATGKTAQSIRNRSKLHRMGHHYRTRLPRPLSRETALRPYSWEEAVGTAVLTEANDFEDEVLVMCKSLNEPGKFVVLTERLIMTVKCPALINLGKPEFRGISSDPEWIVEVRIGLESVIHVDTDESAVNIVGSSSESLNKRNQQQRRAQRWSGYPTPLPLFQTTLELRSEEEARYFLLVLMSTIEQGKERGWGNVHLLHQSTLK